MSKSEVEELLVAARCAMAAMSREGFPSPIRLSENDRCRRMLAARTSFDAIISGASPLRRIEKR